MREDENGLTPEASSKQSENSLDEFSPQDRRLIQSLQIHSQEYKQENEDSLDRIWGRLAQSREHAVSLPQQWKEHKVPSFDMKDTKAMQEQHDLPGTTPSLYRQPPKPRARWRRLGVGLAATVAILMIVAFAIFANVVQPGTTASRTGKDGKLVCSFANNNPAQLDKNVGYAPNLAWSAKGQIATTYSNVKTFAGKNCGTIFSKSIPSNTGVWSPDGKKFAALAEIDNSFLSNDTNSKNGVMFFPDFNLVVLDSAGNTIAQFSPKALSSEGVTGMAWSPDGKKLIFLSRETSILSSGETSRSVSVKSVEAVSGGKVTTLLTITMPNEKMGDPKAMPIDPLFELMSLSPDGKLVAVGVNHLTKFQAGSASYGLKSVEIWNVNTRQKESSISTNSLVERSSALQSSGIAWSPDDSQIALGAGRRNNIAQIFATSNGQLQASFVDASAATVLGIAALSWSPDGNFLAESGSAISIWDIKQGKMVATFGKVNAQHLIVGLAWAPDSQGLASATVNFAGSDASKNTVNVWALS